MQRPSQALISKWYAKLKATGFRDIEGGRDLNRLHATTLAGDRHVQVPDYKAWEDAETKDGLDDVPVTACDKFQAWSMFLSAVHELSELDQRKPVLFEIGMSGNVAATARKLKRPKQKVMAMFHQFCEQRLPRLSGLLWRRK